MKKNKIFTIFILVFFQLSCENMGHFSSSSIEDPADPLLKYAWHLSNYGQAVFAPSPGVTGIDLNLKNTWASQIYGKGIIIQISDDGVQDEHEDIKDNFPYYNYSKNYMNASPYTGTTGPPIASTDNHGTAVAGLAAAVGFNGKGSRGVAPLAKIVSVNFLSDSVSRDGAMLLDQTNGDFDISNMSWGGKQNAVYSQDAAYVAQLKNRVTNGRDGKGTIFVKASGNDFLVECQSNSAEDCIGNSNFDEDNGTPYIILAAAMNSIGESASYSSVGSNLWVSSYGGEFGGKFSTDSPAMLTLDRVGCNVGFSVLGEFNNFEAGNSSENSNCNYTAAFNGTSAAAPVLTGAIALILEVNPNLTWREIKYILAKSAKVDNYITGSVIHPLGNTMPSGYVWEQNWITNAAQFNFNNWYGFGRVDVDAAVELAKTAETTPINLGTYTETTAFEQTALGLAIPDNSATGVSTTINVGTNLKIEGVQIAVNITHTDVSELAIELTSPGGTKSIVLNGQNSLKGQSNFELGNIFLTNAFYQESSLGNWIVKIVDTKNGATGTLNDVRLYFVGGS